MTRYVILFERGFWRVRPALFARGYEPAIAIDYSRACKIADYLNWRSLREAV